MNAYPLFIVTLDVTPLLRIWERRYPCLPQLGRLGILRSNELRHFYTYKLKEITLKNKESIMMMMMVVIIVLLVCVIGIMSFGSFDNLKSSIVEMLGGTMPSESIPTQEAIVAKPTEEPTAEPTEEPTAEPTEEPTAEPTEEPTEEPTAEPTAEPTEEPTEEPTVEPTAEPTEEPTEEPTVEPTATSVEKTSSAITTNSSAQTGAGTLSFEPFGSWKRGDQPYGTFAQSGDPVHGGSFAGKLSYDFSAASAADDYVIFTQRIATSGTPNLAQAWVYGDKSGHLLNLWIEDANGEVWAAPMGAVSFTGWQQMSGAIDANAPWPGGRVYGPDNGTIDYPIRFLGLVVDRTDGPKTGTLSFDDITFSTGAAPANTPAPANTTAPVTAFTSCPKIEGALSVNCYNIEGSTGEELVASIGPDELFVGTAADVWWEWDNDAQGNCNLATTNAWVEYLDVNVAIWSPPAGTPPDLIAEWESFFTNQVARAQLRVNLWNDRYKEVENAVKGATCESANDVGVNSYNTLKAEINAQVDTAIPSAYFLGRK